MDDNKSKSDKEESVKKPIDIMDLKPRTEYATKSEDNKNRKWFF